MVSRDRRQMGRCRSGRLRRCRKLFGEVGIEPWTGEIKWKCMLWHPPDFVVRGAGGLSRRYVGGETSGGAFSRATNQSDACRRVHQISCCSSPREEHGKWTDGRFRNSNAVAAEIRVCGNMIANVHPHSLCSTIVHVDQTVSRIVGNFVGISGIWRTRMLSREMCALTL